MMISPKVKGAVVIGLLLAVMYGTYQYGRHTERKITTFSQLVEKTQGRKTYLIDTEIVCTNGKDLGKLQVDLDLTNGKLHVVRNDNQLEPNCTR